MPLCFLFWSYVLFLIGGTVRRVQDGPGIFFALSSLQTSAGVAGAASGCPDTKPQMGVPGDVHS